MTDRKLKNLLREKPFLIDENFSITAAEAKRIMAEMGPLSIDAMLAKARTKDAWTPDFEALIRSILSDTLPARWNRLRVRVQSGLRHLWTFHAKAVVTWFVILLLAATMLFTPVGKAVADTISRYIVTILDGSIQIKTLPDESAAVQPAAENSAASSTANPGEETVEDGDFLEREYDSMEAFMEDTGLHPVCLQSDEFPIDSIVLYYEPEIIQTLETIYRNQDGIQINLYQDWTSAAAGSEEHIAADEDDSLLQTTVLGGAPLSGYYDAINHEFAAAVVLEDSTLTILYVGDVDYRMVLQSLMQR